MASVRRARITLERSLLGAFLPFGSGEIEEGLDPWQVALSFVAAGLLVVVLGLVEDRVAALRRR